MAVFQQAFGMISKPETCMNTGAKTYFMPLIAA